MSELTLSSSKRKRGNLNWGKRVRVPALLMDSCLTVPFFAALNFLHLSHYPTTITRMTVNISACLVIL